MQTTLRLNDTLFREAKAEAAREGMTLTGFLEDALLLRIRFGRRTKTAAPPLPVFDGGKRLSPSFDLPAAIRAADNATDQAIVTGLKPHHSGRRRPC